MAVGGRFFSYVARPSAYDRDIVSACVSSRSSGTHAGLEATSGAVDIGNDDLGLEDHPGVVAA